MYTNKRNQNKPNQNKPNHNKPNHNKEYKYEERLYMRTMLEVQIALYPTEIGQNKTRQNLQQTIVDLVEGKCICEGYVQPNSVRVNQYSSGIVKGDKIEFTVVFECNTANPMEGTHVQCTVKSVTKAGIHADAYDKQGNIPVTIFVARDQFVENPNFQKVKEKDVITVSVIGSRFELNDYCVEVLGEIIRTNT
jgi:DNA-directed RNA polymerase subunit E'/Rpb7